MFAAVEAAIWVFKQEAVDQHANGAVIFEPSELILLSEKSPVLDSDGALREAPLAIRFAPNVIFAFKCHARAHNYLPVLDVGDYRWDLLKRSSQVRNRLMHPKGLASLQVSDQEISDARRSLSWFLKTSSLALLEASGWFAFQSAAKIPDSQRSVEVQRLLKEKIDELRLTIESSL
jgi:hypothetical protein